MLGSGGGKRDVLEYFSLPSRSLQNHLMNPGYEKNMYGRLPKKKIIQRRR